MKTKLSYLTINVLFIEDLDSYGLWIGPHCKDVEEFDMEWGKWPLLNENEGYILIKDSLKGYGLVDTLHHEFNHAGWWLYAPADEESQVRVASSVWHEALSRSKPLRDLVQREIQ